MHGLISGMKYRAGNDIGAEISCMKRNNFVPGNTFHIWSFMETEMSTQSLGYKMQTLRKTSDTDYLTEQTFL